MKEIYRYIWLAVFGSLVIAWSGCGNDAGQRGNPAIRVGSKNFTEQLILSEMMASMIENHSGLSVERRFNLGGTMICHGALRNEEIDLYAEYTGTALTAILNQEVISDPDAALKVVDQSYNQQWNLDWLKPFGFNNTYAITVSEEDAEENGWENISDLAGPAEDLTAGFTAEFSERQDGYPGIKKAYGFAFGKVRDLDPGLMYKAVAQGEVDVICAFATDGRIAAYNLLPLKDDKQFFPPYYAAPVVRAEVLQKHPELKQVLGKLEGVLDDQKMQQLNYEVDEKKRSVDEVAREFLVNQGLLENGSEN
jgi:glycine betaine/choline ABC-type transport system substrate-binding protein